MCTRLQFASLTWTDSGWLFSHNTVTAGSCPDDCQNAVWAVTCHVLLVVALNVVALLVIYHGRLAFTQHDSSVSCSSHVG